VTDQNEFSRQREWLAQTFGGQAVAYRMLGFRTEADNAVQQDRVRLTAPMPTRSGIWAAG